MIKPKLWNGKDLKGEWLVTLKIDGVRCLIEDGVALSRSGKPLYNVPATIPDGDYEVYAGDWETSVSLVRTKNGPPIPEEFFYSLHPLDDRLLEGVAGSPPAEFINSVMETYVEDGYEGLVLRQGEKELKVKPVENYDVAITGLQEGTGKYVGMLGAFITDMGKVGTGLTDVMREEYKDLEIGTIIEVECMSLTPAGKFRHPRLKRIRWDK